MNRAALPAAALYALLAGCASSPPLADGLPAGRPERIELGDTPFFPQEDYQCGPAALATLLKASGVAVDPLDLKPQVYVPKRHGSLQAELIGAARRHGRMPYPLAATADEMIAELAEGRPVLVLQNLGISKIPIWHYAVLIGYDREKNVAILRSGKRERVEMRWQRFAGSWHRGSRWALAVLEPGAIPEYADASRYLEAAAGLEAAGQRHAAEAAYESAVARWPEEPNSWLGRGNIAYADGDREAAADAWTRAIQLAPQGPAARNNLAQLLMEASCREEAEHQIERAAALAAQTPLAAVVAETRATILKMPETGAACAFDGRVWPD